MADPRVLETRLDRLWREWLEARKAMTSNSVVDGIEAGRAWSRWLAEFVPEAKKPGVHHGAVR